MRSGSIHNDSKRELKDLKSGAKKKTQEINNSRGKLEPSLLETPKFAFAPGFFNNAQNNSGQGAMLFDKKKNKA